VRSCQRRQLERGGTALSADFPAFTLTRPEKDETREHALPSGATNCLLLALAKPFCAMSMVVARLDVEVVRARALEAAAAAAAGAFSGGGGRLLRVGGRRANPNPNPYVVLRVNDLTVRSETRAGTCDPLWNAAFRMTLLTVHDALRVRVYDEDSAAAKMLGLRRGDGFLGGTTIPLLALKNSTTKRGAQSRGGDAYFVEGWFPLTKDEVALDRLAPTPPPPTTTTPTPSTTKKTNTVGTPAALGEVYLRLRLTTTWTGEVMSRFTPFPESLFANPIEPPPLDIDVLYRQLNRCLAYLYPLLDGVAAFTNLLNWKVYWKSCLCLCIMVALSLRADLVPLFLHGMLLRHLAWSKATKSMRLQSHLRNKVLRGEEGEGKEETEIEEEEEEEEAGLGTTVAALMLLCPGWLKETLRGTQASLDTLANALDMCHGMLHWKEENTTWGIVGATVVSAMVFYWVRFSTWLQLLGVTFLLSGTSVFRLAVMLLSGTAGEISGRLLQGPSIELWLRREEKVE
jgi:hypothetical protein